MSRRFSFFQFSFPSPRIYCNSNISELLLYNLIMTQALRWREVDAYYDLVFAKKLIALLLDRDLLPSANGEEVQPHNLLP